MTVDLGDIRDCYAEFCGQGAYSGEYANKWREEGYAEFDEAIRQVREHAFAEGVLAQREMLPANEADVPENPHVAA